MTTKIVALTDALGNLVSFELLPGQRHDTIGVAPLIGAATFGSLIADKAFDVNRITDELDRRGAEVVISRNYPPPLPRVSISGSMCGWIGLICSS